MASNLTPEQLDAIATKLLGWKRDDQHPYVRFYSVVVHKTDKAVESWREYHRALDPSSPADAMLVLKAMGEWCASRNMWVQLESELGQGWLCEVTRTERHPAGHDTEVTSETVDTPEAAIFACAAKLVERMDER